MSLRKCPKCGGRMQQGSKQCAVCRGYGSYRAMARGYVRIWKPDHPLARRDGYVLEHRMVLFDAGHDVPADAHVHHINGVKHDNRLENLEVTTHAEHMAKHRRVTDEQKRVRHAAYQREWRRKKKERAA